MTKPASDEFIAEIGRDIAHDDSLNLHSAINVKFSALIARIRQQDAEIERLNGEIIDAVEFERENCADRFETAAREKGRPECCGRGVLAPDFECCGDYVCLIEEKVGVAAIRNGGKP